MRRGALLVVVLALVAVSCGSPSMSEEAADKLQTHMDDLRSAVERENPEQAEAKLDKLRAEARERADEGEVTADRLAQIESAAAQVERFLDDLGTQPLPEPEPEPEPEAEPEPEPEPQPEPEPEEDEQKPEEEKDHQEEGADQGEGEEGDGGPGKEDEEGPGATNGEGGQTDGNSPEDETDTARAT